MWHLSNLIGFLKRNANLRKHQNSCVQRGETRWGSHHLQARRKIQEPYPTSNLILTLSFKNSQKTNFYFWSPQSMVFFHYNPKKTIHLGLVRNANSGPMPNLLNQETLGGGFQLFLFYQDFQIILIYTKSLRTTDLLCLDEEWIDMIPKSIYCWKYHKRSYFFSVSITTSLFFIHW